MYVYIALFSFHQRQEDMYICSSIFDVWYLINIPDISSITDLWSKIFPTKHLWIDDFLA